MTPDADDIADLMKIAKLAVVMYAAFAVILTLACIGAWLVGETVEWVDWMAKGGRPW